MARVREFGYAIDVSEEFLRYTPNAKRYVADAFAVMRDKTELRGPLGGRYEPIGDLYGYHEAQLDFGKGTKTLTILTRARYLRPKRITA